MFICQFCNNIYRNVNQHITKKHGFRVEYASLAEGAKVKLFNNTTLIGETTWSEGNHNWFECWLCVDGDHYWMQQAVDPALEDMKTNVRHIVKNNGIPDKVEEYFYAKYVKNPALV